MDSKSLALFKSIFHEAHIIDLDASKWDKYFRVVVVARALEPEDDGRFPVFNVDFIDVVRFHWDSNHMGVSLDDDKHCQWTVMDYNVEEGATGIGIALLGFAPAPTVEILCGDIRITQANSSMIDSVNPAWNQPYGPLARPSIEELDMMNRKRRS